MWVVKVGGHATVNLEAVLDDLAAWAHEGQRWILVHGISAQADALGHALGHPPRHVTSVSGRTSRYTDARTIEILMMAYGAFNARIVASLRRRGVDAIGLRGIDGGIIRARRKAILKIRENGRVLILRGDHSGKIEGLRTGLLHTLVQQGLYPVMIPLGITPDGTVVNIDGDRVAARIAVAMRASGLILLTGAPGLLRDYPDESTRVEVLSVDALEQAMVWAQGRMRTKLEAAGEALRGGVGCVVLADGRVERPVYCALAGEGTRIVARSA